MPLSRPLITALGASAAAVLGAALLTSEPTRSDATVELQLGPILVAFGGEDDALSVRAEACLRQGCPLVSVRNSLVSGPTLQGTPGETGRVQRLQPIALETGRLSAQGAGNLLSQEGRVSEASRSQSTEQDWTAEALPDT